MANDTLGWLALCLNVSDLGRSVAFYGKLDYVRIGGNLEEGWALMGNPGGEIHLFSGHISANLLNFRGGDVPAIVDRLTDEGLETDGEVTRGEGGAGSATFKDPDGLAVFFDTDASEARRFPTGAAYTVEGAEERIRADGLLLGSFTYCLDCADLGKTVAFYETLGLEAAGGDPEHGWAILCLPGAVPKPGTLARTPHLSLFQGMLDGNMLNFRGGDCFALAEVLASRGIEIDKGPITDAEGSDNLFLSDPDGNVIYFNTYPSERLY